MKIDWKKAIGLTAAVSMLVPLAACGGSSDGGDKNASGSTEAVTLSVWAPQEDQAKDTNWLGKVEENFAKAHPEYNITWKNDVVSEGDASKQVSTDPSAAADVYMFASDQLGVLMDAKAIGQLGTDAEKQVKEQNGDLEVNSVTGTDGKLYGVPYTDNTWFMYYNKSKITEDEAKDFDTILSKAKVAFSLQNSWYINGFYDGLSLFGEKGNDADAGMVFPKDGADITSYLVDVVANPNFSNDDGASGLAAIKDGLIEDGVRLSVAEACAKIGCHVERHGERLVVETACVLVDPHAQTVAYKAIAAVQGAIVGHGCVGAERFHHLKALDGSIAEKVAASSGHGHVVAVAAHGWRASGHHLVHLVLSHARLYEEVGVGPDASRGQDDGFGVNFDDIA